MEETTRGLRTLFGTVLLRSPRLYHCRCQPQQTTTFRPLSGLLTESTTIGGLLSEWLGRVPVTGESVERDGIQAEVLAGNDLRVEQVRIRKVPKTLTA